MSVHTDDNEVSALQNMFTAVDAGVHLATCALLDIKKKDEKYQAGDIKEF